MVKRILRCHFALILLAALPAFAQTFPEPSYFQRFFARPGAHVRNVPGPAALEQYVTDGKLRLSLADAIRLTLLNDTDVRISLLQTDISEYALLKTYGPFDPVFTSNYNPVRSVSPTTSTLQGAQTLSSLNQQFSSTYSQLFGTGTLYQVSMNAGKNASNSIFSTFNPAISSSLNIAISQPLLRNRGWFVNHAPIVIAKRNLQQTKANFEAFVNDTMLTVVNQYWDVVQARQNLAVQRESLDLADASYKHDKRALELGALSPLDIYRSESQVAQRKLQVIQAEYALKGVEDILRRTIGADLDARTAALDLDLYESADIIGEPPTPDIQQVTEAAMQARPELTALEQQAAIDAANLRVATNGMKPDLNFSTFYNTSGRGGNQIDSSSGTPVTISSGGFGDSLDQLGSLNFPTYGFNVQLRLPLRNRSAAADMGTALVSQRRTQYQRRQREEGIILEARNAVHGLEQGKLSVAAGKISRDLAQKNLQAEQRKYELGTETIFFVLDAQNQLSQAELTLLQAQINYQRAVATVDRVTGELLKHYRVQIAEATP
jgi:outer membrane protein